MDSQAREIFLITGVTPDFTLDMVFGKAKIRKNGNWHFGSVLLGAIAQKKGGSFVEIADVKKEAIFAEEKIEKTLKKIFKEGLAVRVIVEAVPIVLKKNDIKSTSLSGTPKYEMALIKKVLSKEEEVLT
ncbi:MAG: hypothetical protein WC928_02410 [Patescibacteria group bacterium]|jgi:hypothetical protein